MFTRALRFSKLVVSLIVCLTAAVPAFAGDVYVNGYTRKDGSYVQPHYRTAPDSTVNNNWSTQGNVNPYTGQAGTVPRNNYGTGGGMGYGTGNNNSNTSPYGTQQPAQPYGRGFGQ